MQFETTEKVGQTTKKVLFSFFDKLPIKVQQSFETIFTKLSAKNTSTLTWHFPTHVSNETIATIIKNTCFMCGGLMKDSTAYQNTLVSFNDFGNDVGQRGTTQSRIGKAKQIKVRKCSSCGHSHT